MRSEVRTYIAQGNGDLLGNVLTYLSSNRVGARNNGGGLRIGGVPIRQYEDMSMDIDNEAHEGLCNPSDWLLDNCTYRGLGMILLNERLDEEKDQITITAEGRSQSSKLVCFLKTFGFKEI